MSNASDSHRGLGYFPSIDGLRSIAVLSVFLFHLNNELLPGGYAGVDIFFVISGFVVTASLAHTSFTRFRDFVAFFYARRFVRILPPMIVCMIITFVLYTVFIPRSLLSSLTEWTGWAAFIGFSNLILAGNKDDYFAPIADFNPFLHTWSLGVEEQFYFVFPFLLFLYSKSYTRPSHRRATLAIISATGLASFVCCGLLTAIKWDYGFYLLPSRFWELALGMLLALTYYTWKPRLEKLSDTGMNLLSALWVVMLLAAFTWPSGPYFPFPVALLPTFAAGLAIVLCVSRPDHAVSRALGSWFPLTVGLRSYSLYLWHWPIIVLMRWTTSIDTIYLTLIAALLAFAMAELSYRFVEMPFRRSRQIKMARRSKVALGGIAAAAAGTALGFSIAVARPAISISKTVDIEVWQSRRDSKLLPGPAGCSLAHQERTLDGSHVDHWERTGCASAPGKIYAIGDSHALGYAPLLRQMTLDTGHETVLYFKSGCGYLYLYKSNFSDESCGAYLQAATQELTAKLRPGDIVLLSTFRLKQPINQWGLANPAGFTKTEEDAGMIEARAVLARLAKTGATIVFEAPKPMMGAPVYRCADWYTRPNPICAAGLVVDRTTMLNTRQPIMRMMETLERETPNVVIWDPLPALCPGNKCLAFDHGKPLFFDMHHLSNYGNMVLRTSFQSFTAHELNGPVLRAANPNPLLSAASHGGRDDLRGASERTRPRTDLMP